MQDIKLSVYGIAIIQGKTDKVYISTNLPPANKNQDVLVLQVEFPLGEGEEYIKKHFGVEPKVILD